MKTSHYTDSQIMAILKQAEAGTPVPQLCREHGMDASMKMYVEERLKVETIQEAMAKKW